MIKHLSAAGLVKVRLIGEESDVSETLQQLGALTGVEVLEASGPYPSRRGPGVRAYLTVRLVAPGAARRITGGGS